jgi:hypothetical protein
MDQRAVKYPARSIDIRITIPECGDYLLSAQVERALQVLVEHVSYDAAESGRVEITQQQWEPAIIIEWQAAATIDPPEDEPEPETEPVYRRADGTRVKEYNNDGTHDLEYFFERRAFMSKQEMLDGLTDAERAALEE